MKTITFLILSILVISTFQTEGQRLKSSANYFKSTSKVGISVITIITADQAIGSADVIGASLFSAKSTSKYDEPLKTLEPTLNPFNKIKNSYEEIYSQKGKSVAIITDNLDSLDFKEFTDPKTGKEYYNKDLRPLKELFHLDEILLVRIIYGIRIGINYGIESSRLGFCLIQTGLVNLNDNSFIFLDGSLIKEKIHGDWNTPPAYENLKTSIQTAIEKGITKEKEKYKKLRR